MRVLLKRWAIVLGLLAVWGCAEKPPVTAVPKEALTTAPAVRPGQWVSYTVKRGDTLISIANLYGVAAGSIMEANRLKNQYQISPGQKLFIPRGAVSPGVGKMPDLSRIASESHFIWPLRGRVIKRFVPGGNELEHTRGVLIEARSGEPVVAAMSGVVTFASEAFQGYGKTVLIRHANNLSTFYAGNSRLLVGVGDTVKQGQRIAEAGQTGRATSPQLLFRILFNEEPLDPLSYLP